MPTIWMLVYFTRKKKHNMHIPTYRLTTPLMLLIGLTEVNCNKDSQLCIYIKSCILLLCYFVKQSKLEKADVLEITVQHMEGLQRGLGPGETIKCSFDFCVINCVMKWKISNAISKLLMLEVQL